MFCFATFFIVLFFLFVVYLTVNKVVWWLSRRQRKQISTWHFHFDDLRHSAELVLDHDLILADVGQREVSNHQNQLASIRQTARELLTHLNPTRQPISLALRSTACNLCALIYTTDLHSIDQRCITFLKLDGYYCVTAICCESRAAREKIIIWFFNSFWGKREVQKGHFCFGPSFTKCNMAARRIYLSKKKAGCFWPDNFSAKCWKSHENPSRDGRVNPLVICAFYVAMHACRPISLHGQIVHWRTQTPGEMVSGTPRTSVNYANEYNLSDDVTTHFFAK